ncbi:MAG TPA: 2-dehydropantoate 2-reductase [Burkholderiaceae bacterium]
MKIAVMGAGAVGCYYGGMLARAGHAVTLIGRPEHVGAIRRDGLWLDTQSFEAHVTVEASTELSAVHGAELLLFCVKSMDTESVGMQLRPHLAPHATVLTLQNGADNAERLQAVIPQEVGATVVYVGAGMAGPGHVRHFGRGELLLAPVRRGAELAELFSKAGIPTQVSDNVTGALWTKLLINCAYNALSAITQLPYGRLVEGVGVGAVMNDAVQEGLAVAKARGVQIAGDIDAAVRNIATSMAGQFSSTAQDLARGKPSEIDHLNGYLVRQGEALGVPTPVIRALHALVKLLEAKAVSSLP